MLVDIRPNLRAFLLAQDAIAVLVDNTHIYPGTIPQEVRAPSIVYNVISNIGDHHMQGPSGLARPRYQIDAYARTQDEAATLGNTIKFYLDGFQGVMHQAVVQGVFFQSERTIDYQPEVDMYRDSKDYLIHFEER